jgi:hypothetical protein
MQKATRLTEENKKLTAHNLHLENESENLAQDLLNQRVRA